MVDVLFSERMRNRINEWRDRLLQFQNGEFQCQGSPSDSKQQFETLFYKMRPAISLNGFTSHQLRLIQLVIRKNFEDLSYVRLKGENCDSQHLIVYTDSKDDRDLLMKEVNDEHRKHAVGKIQAAIGFRHVIDLLSSEKKLIVGHNCFLDIAHVHNKFVGPLPFEAEDFVASIHKYFPHIIDTKILLNTHPILQQRMKKSKTSLSSAFTLLCPHIALSVSSGIASDSYVKVEAQVDDSRCSSWNAGAKHEAGYDAFMTGCIFAQACSYVGIDFKLRLSAENLAHNEKLQKHINHLYLSWTNADIIDLRTGNKVTETLESNPKRRFSNISFESIVLIWGFPSKLKAKDIRCCITKAFGPTSVTSVYHLDETAVFVYFSKTDFVSKFFSLKKNLERSNDDPISVLNPLTELLEGGNTYAAAYETYKEICSSPISKLLFADQAEATRSKWKTKMVESELAFENSSSKNSTKAASDLKSESFFGQISRDDDDKIINSLYSAEDTQPRTSNMRLTRN
ncbi:poly(A)-specific ribonuclease PARN isoform X2 [Humulus lupulus]|nr:poly(A)-specific ribonuclease PARN isoform X2 [Humulus lupulus]